MIKLNETKGFKTKGINDKLKQDYLVSLKSDSFKKVIVNLMLSHDELMRYTSRLEACAIELDNCSKCKNLGSCKNEIIGFKLTPNVEGKQIKFSYIACKYKSAEIKENEKIKNTYLNDMPKEIANAQMKDIFINDKGRKDVIIYLQKFIKDYDEKSPSKGLYLHGNFGCGKTYLVAATINELLKKNIKSVIIYWPEFLRDLKASFDDDFKEKFEIAKRAKILLIDDIGAENLTSWARDEILAPILQYRMESHLTTFFTSNLSLEDLEVHLSITKGKVDLLKSKRIIERINKLTDQVEMNASNLRK